MADLTPLINGQAYAWVDIIVSINNVPLAGITSVEYSDAGAITENYGQGRFPVSRSQGKIEAKAKISIDRAELNALIASAPFKRLQNIPEFDIIVSYLPESSAPVTDIIKNCRFKGVNSGGSEGDSNIVGDLEIATSHIEWSAL